MSSRTAILLSVVLGASVTAANAAGLYEPIRLLAGVNQVRDIAGDGKSGTITLNWRGNGNAWGYDLFTVVVGGSVATHDGRDNFQDAPHTGKYIVTSVRFARALYRGQRTLHALVASRALESGVPGRSSTTITIYALAKNEEGSGTPYEFAKVRTFLPKRRYCNAEMALKTEIGLPLTTNYLGLRTIDGC